METKKKCLRAALISFIVDAVLVIISVICFCFTDDDHIALGINGFIFAASALSVLILSFSLLNDANKLYCNKCGVKYDYENVNWKISEQYETNNSVNAIDDFEIYCPNCGAQREYSRKYRVANIDNNGHLHSHNLENIISRQYKRKK